MIRIEFTVVKDPRSRRGDVIYEIETQMMLDGYPHIPAEGEEMLFPGEPPSDRRVVVGVLRRYKKQDPRLKVIVALMRSRDLAKVKS